MIRRLLLIGLHYHRYDQQIKMEFERQGYDVDLETDTPTYYGAIESKLPEEKLKRFVKQHQNQILKRIHNKKYNLIVVIVGHYLSREFVQTLKHKNINSRMILYLWDDVRRVGSFERTHDLYDKIYSFDIADCQNYGFSFLPLFYVPEYDGNLKLKKKYDLYSAMVEHSDRRKILETLLKDNPTRSFKFVLLIGKYNFFNLIFCRIFKNNKQSGEDKRLLLKGFSINEKTNHRLMMQSRAILDIQYASQNGLTMRTIEALGTGIKLITTNKYVRYYDFYNPNNICIIDRNAPTVKWEFFDEPFIQIDSSIFRKYSIEEWVHTILYNNDKVYLNCGLEEVKILEV